MTEKTLKKLAQLLEQDQFELIFPEDMQAERRQISEEKTHGTDIKLVYLMNDAVESFLVFRNARMTGEYHSEYQGQLQASMNRQADGYVLVVRQGATVLMIGLSVCAAIVKAHGSDITAKNKSGGGAVFSFALEREGEDDGQ